MQSYCLDRLEFVDGPLVVVRRSSMILKRDPDVFKQLEDRYEVACNGGQYLQVIPENISINTCREAKRDWHRA